MRDQQFIQQFIDRRPRTSDFLLFLSGALTMLSFAPAGWYPVAPILLLPFLFVCLTLPAKRAAHLGFWYGAGLFLTGTYWLYTSIHVIGRAPLWVAIIIMFGLVMIMALYYALTAWLISRLAAGNKAIFLFAAPAAWVSIEWLRGWFLSGFPWMSLGYGQIDSPLSGLAPVIGVYGLSFILLISASALLVAIVSTGRLRATALVLLILPWIIGGGLQGIEWTDVSGKPLRITIVQGGVSQERKWLAEQFLPTLNLYRSSLDAHTDSDLIVWPEVAIPATIDQLDGYLDGLKRVATERQQSLMLGILERQVADDAIFNSMLLLDSGPRQVYRKRHLVPFGEFFPVPGFVRRWMRMMSLPTTDLAAGAAEQALLVTASGAGLAVAICYEDAYGAEQLYALPEAGILINVSNDAWFGDSIAPHQHLEIARMRALEVGRYVVRSTNNGVSAFIAPDGKILERGPQFEYIEMTRNITPLNGLTPYARFGNWPVISFSLLLVAGLGYRARNRAGNTAG